VIRATLDSNIYISALQYGGVGLRIINMTRAGKMHIDISDAILAETIGVLRDKFSWEGYRLHLASLELRKLARVVAPAETIDVADDPDDNRVLECAVAAQSNVIVTYDKDLLRLREYSGIKILRADEFLRLLSQGDPL